MPNITIKITILGGPGSVTISKFEMDDIKVDRTPLEPIYVDLPLGVNYFSVAAMPPNDGSVSVAFLQNGELLDAHTFKSPKIIPFIVEVS